MYVRFFNLFLLDFELTFFIELTALDSRNSFCYLENIAYHRARSMMPELKGKIIENYMLTTRVLGRGGFGEVLLTVDRNTNEHIACKVSKRTNKRGFQPATEVKILSQLCHVKYQKYVFVLKRNETNIKFSLTF